MKRIILYILPFFAATVLFAFLVIFISQRTGKGALQVTASTPSEVYLNGKLIGVTPLCKCEGKEMIGVGEYNVRLIPKDKSLDPYEEKVRINKSTLSVIDRTFGESSSASVITLEESQDKNSAQITVITSPVGSEVFLDSNPSGKSPLSLKNVTESDHELKFTREGYVEKTVRIKTTKGFLLKVIAYLGASPIATSGSSGTSIQVSITPTPSTTKLLILDTPTGFLRVRSSGSASTSEVGRVNPGETYDLLEEEEGWYKIELENGVIGWISSQYAQKQQ